MMRGRRLTLAKSACFAVPRNLSYFSKRDGSMSVDNFPKLNAIGSNVLAIRRKCQTCKRVATMAKLKILKVYP